CAVRLFHRLSLERRAGEKSRCRFRQNCSRSMKFMKKTLVMILLCGLSVGITAVAQTAQTLTLSEAHEMALKNHPRIAAANYRIGAAEAVTKDSRAGFFPQVTLYGSAVGADSADTRIEAGGLNNPSIFDRAAGGLSASQLITDFGRTANLTASSKYQAQAES